MLFSVPTEDLLQAIEPMWKSVVLSPISLRLLQPYLTYFLYLITSTEIAWVRSIENLQNYRCLTVWNKGML